MVFSVEKAGCVGLERWGTHNRCDNAFLTGGTVANGKGITCSPHSPSTWQKFMDWNCDRRHLYKKLMIQVADPVLEWEKDLMMLKNRSLLHLSNIQCNQYKPWESERERDCFRMQPQTPHQLQSLNWLNHAPLPQPFRVKTNSANLCSVKHPRPQKNKRWSSISFNKLINSHKDTFCC